VRTSTNPTGPEVNDHVSLQWSSYKQLQGSNLIPQREQTSWSQAFTTRPPLCQPISFFLGGGVDGGNSFMALISMVEVRDGASKCF